MRYADDATKLVGGTPLVRLNRVVGGAPALVLAKLEMYNPASSVKDRIGVSMIEAAERDGAIHADTVLLKPTSGNTGIALAWVAAARGYRLTLVMPESMSLERRQVLKVLGAELVLTPAAEGMPGAVRKGQEMATVDPRYLLLQQFENVANPAIHRLTTGPGDLARHRRQGRHPRLRRGDGRDGHGRGRGAERAESLGQLGGGGTGGFAGALGRPEGPHPIQGIGAGFVPGVLRTDLLDEIIRVPTDGAIEMTFRLAREEGLFVGISSGAAAWAAVQVARRPENEGKVIVVVFPDSGDRYLSTAIFQKVLAEETPA